MKRNRINPIQYGLLLIHWFCESCQKNNSPVPINQLTAKHKKPWIKKYRDLIAEGWKCNPLSDPPLKKKKRGRPKKTKAQNLLVRLGEYESSVLAFLHDINVPFSNNLAEQDIRMIKVRLKISGCFRTIQGAKYFARIRSHLFTARKQNLNILDSITEAISGHPFIPVKKNHFTWVTKSEAMASVSGLYMSRLYHLLKNTK